MKQILLVVFAYCVLLVACGPSMQDAQNFNTKLVGVNNSLQSDMQNLDNAVNRCIEKRDFDGIKLSLQSAQEHLAEFEKSVAAYPAPKGGEQFKTAVLDYLKSTKDITDVYAQLPKTATDEEVNKLMDKVDALYKTEEGKMKAAQDAQAAYAKSIGMQLK